MASENGDTPRKNVNRWGPARGNGPTAPTTIELPRGDPPVPPASVVLTAGEKPWLPVIDRLCAERGLRSRSHFFRHCIAAVMLAMDDETAWGLDLTGDLVPGLPTFVKVDR